MITPSNAPKEQRSFADNGSLSVDDLAVPLHRRDVLTAGQPAQPGDAPGDASVNPGEQGRYGNLKQNPTIHWRVQER